MRGKRNYPGSPVIAQTVTMADTKTPVTDSHDTPSIAGNVIGHGAMINMQHYQDTVPLWRRVWQHSLTQMMLLSIQAFCGPAMADAITGETDPPLYARLHNGLELSIMFYRPRWRWSCLYSGVKYLERNWICHAGNRYVSSPNLSIETLTRNSLLHWRSSCKQNRHQVGFYSWLNVLPSPRLGILL